LERELVNRGLRFEDEECRDGVGDIVPLLPGVDQPLRGGPGRMGRGPELAAVLPLTVDNGRGLAKEDGVCDPVFDTGLVTFSAEDGTFDEGPDGADDPAVFALACSNMSSMNCVRVFCMVSDRDGGGEDAMPRPMLDALCRDADSRAFVMRRGRSARPSLYSRKTSCSSTGGSKSDAGQLG
jgi:hypothetical protein